jgi:hypothetical protein
MQLSFEYGDTIIEFNLTQSRRKTLAITLVFWQIQKITP